MLRPKFSELDYPEPLGLQILDGYVTDDQMLEIISKYSSLNRKKRRIIFPSRVCQRKVFLHWMYKKILSGEIKWADLKKEIKKGFGTLWFARMTLTHLKEAHWRREHEIEIEISK